MGVFNQDRRNVGLAIVLIATAFFAAGTPWSFDLGLYLRSGYEAIAHHNVALDASTFTHYGQPWNNHAWLGNVVIYFLHHLGGYFLLIAAFASLQVAIIWLAWVRMPKGSRSALLVLALTTVACMPFYRARTQEFSALMFTVTLLTIDQAKAGKRALLWALVPMMVLWSNLHGGYQGGVILLFASAVGAVWHGWRDVEHRRQHWKLAFTLGAVGVIGFLVAGLNPNGLMRTYMVGLETFRAATMNGIDEWMPPSPVQFACMPYLFMLVVTSWPLVLAVAKKRPFDGIDVVTFCVFAGMSLLGVRHIRLFVMVAAPIMARQLDQALVEPFTNPSRKLLAAAAALSRRYLKPLVLKHGPACVVILTALTVARMVLSASPVEARAAELDLVPNAAIDWLARQPTTGRLYNEYHWGSHLMWKVPQDPVVLDGRIDLCNDGTVDEWKKVLNAAHGSEVSLQRWGVRWVIIKPSRPLLGYLVTRGWRLVYQDKQAVILEQGPSKNSPFPQ